MRKIIRKTPEEDINDEVNIETDVEGNPLFYEINPELFKEGWKPVIKPYTPYSEE